MFNRDFLEDYYRSAIYGAAIGDALGVPWEFCGRKACHCTGMKSGGVHGQREGVWSDDTALLIATGASLKSNCGNVNINDMRTRFTTWMNSGEYAIDNNVFDIGITVSKSLSSGHGMDGERDNGNGSLMRILPLAFTDSTQAEIEAVSAITHAHKISKEACVCYIGIARGLLAGKALPEAITGNLPESPEFSRLATLKALGEDEIYSDGYVVHTLEASLWCLMHANDYRECVLKAVNLGHDTDTTACVAGGLAAIVYGPGCIPEEWIGALRGKDIIERCLFGEE